MSDFHQTTTITTLHSLHAPLDADAYQECLEERLLQHAQKSRITLLLPCLYSELSNREVINRITSAIKSTGYIHSVVVALGRASHDDFSQAKEYFSTLVSTKRSVHLVWIDGPRIQAILNRAQQLNINVGLPGKGQSVWISLGYILGGLNSDVIALHDCDITTYTPTMLARLIEPVADPGKNYEFCKGFYSRISPHNKVMHGRVTRLFVSPFLAAVIPLMRQHGLYRLEQYFLFHQAFRYSLAGEFCMSRNLAKGIDMSYDWGLEVGTLSQVYESLHPRKIAQIDLDINYEHKHQPLSTHSRDSGLHRMVIDIARSYLNVMRTKGYALSDESVDVLQNAYNQSALDCVRRYADDASVNQLHYDRYEEEQTVQHFSQYLLTAWHEVKGSMVSSQLPSWSRISYSIPDIYRDLVLAVDQDNNSEGHST